MVKSGRRQGIHSDFGEWSGVMGPCRFLVFDGLTEVGIKLPDMIELMGSHDA